MAEIRCFVLDVDGVLTDGRLFYGGCTEPLRAFNVQDGSIIMWFHKLGGKCAIITGKESLGVELRAGELGIQHVAQGSQDKLADLKRMLPKLGVELDEIAMIGDDLIDAEVMQACGYPIAVENAVTEIKQIARYVTKRPGGHGAVREAMEHVLREDGRWQQVLERFGLAAVNS